MEMRQYIRQACLSRTFPVTKPQISGWTFLRMTQKSYLIDLMEYKNVYVGAFASSEYVFEDFRDLTASTHGALILSTRMPGKISFTVQRSWTAVVA